MCFFAGVKSIIAWLKDYVTWVNKKTLFISIAFVAVLIFINYHFNLNSHLKSLPSSSEYLAWFIIFAITFSFAYILESCIKSIHLHKNLVLLIFIAPAIFAWKMSYNFNFFISSDTAINTYWNAVIYWPLKLFVITIMLLIVWYAFDRKQSFYGLSSKGFNTKPYFYLLFMMIPLIAVASTQKAFLQLYPRFQNIPFLSSPESPVLSKLIYEISYGIDFAGIELFFRGFLILAFVKYAGKNVILPMALFYCTIHFGKPLGECISSFFGGLILGVITYHTRSIYGGLIVHLGIAWLMEIGGYFGNMYLKI
jgi:hypothetical protein